MRVGRIAKLEAEVQSLKDETGRIEKRLRKQEEENSLLRARLEAAVEIDQDTTDDLVRIENRLMDEGGTYPSFSTLIDKLRGGK